jgi:hypothetical protein
MATVRLQLRRGLAQDWFDANPTLAAGEIGIETDTNTFKFGDGDTLWRDLDYALSGTVDDYIPLTQKAVAGGVASLDSSGFVPVSQLPPLAKVTVNAVANQAARLALTAEAGDIAIQADNGQSYVLSASPASTDANWKALVGSEAVVDTVETALIAGTGLDKTYDDAAGTITIDIDSTVATKTYADQAEADAISTASSDATTKANAAQAAAISAAAADATSKANAAQAAAEATASADATSKANAAKSAAEATASADATSKANAAQAAAEATAAADATTKANAAKTAAEAYADAAVSILTNASPDALNTLNELAAALGDDANFASTVTNSLSLKANINDPSFTGNVTLPSTTIIGSVNNQEIAYLDGVTSPIQGQIDNKAPLASPTLTGTVTLPESTSIGSVSNLEIGYLNGVTSSVQGQIDDKLASATAASTYAPLASPTLTGTVTLPASTSIGDVSNLEIGYLNGVTSSVQGQIDAKAPLESPTFTGTVTLPANTITQSMMSDDSVGTNEIGGFAVTAAKLAVDSVTETKIADGSVTSAKIANGTIVNADINDSAAIAQSKIDGLGAALDLKAPKADPTFTGTVTGVTKAHVGLGNVDNTADASKPVSTAQATAIATAKSEAIADATSQVNALLAGAPAALNTLDELAAALGDDANFASTVTTNLAAKAPIASPTFTGTVTVAAAGVAFTDGTQTKAGVPSLTTIGTEISADYNLSTGGLALRDQLIPVAGTRAITIPTNATTAFPVGTSIDFYQSSGTGANFVAADGTVTILRTPGLKLRTTHSSATLTKVATNTWLLAGDLTA